MTRRQVVVYQGLVCPDGHGPLLAHPDWVSLGYYCPAAAHAVPGGRAFFAERELSPKPKDKEVAR